MRRYSIKSWMMASGERYCFLADLETGLPEYHPLLYVTTQVRNASLSYSAMEQTFSAIGVLLGFMASRDGAGLEQRFLKREFLSPAECQSIRDHCQLDFASTRSRLRGNVISLQSRKVGFRPTTPVVSTYTVYCRLTHIAHYLAWLAQNLLFRSFDRETSSRVQSMKMALLALRPPRKGLNDDLFDTKGLSHEQERLMMSIVAPGSDTNPFVADGVQIRNALMVHVLQSLGIRRGELLNIRIDDIDFKRNELLIIRRADEKGDPRVNQPLVKTRARRLPLDQRLADSLRHYIVHVRRRIPNASKFPYVFVTHKSGPTQGQPLSIEAYKQVIRAIAKTHPLLSKFVGHDLRHTWNDRFSEYMDQKENPETESVQERVREDQMGWAEGSGSAKLYNKRFIRRKGRAAGLALQETAYRAALEAGQFNKKAEVPDK